MEGGWPEDICGHELGGHKCRKHQGCGRPTVLKFGHMDMVIVISGLDRCIDPLIIRSLKKYSKNK